MKALHAAKIMGAMALCVVALAPRARADNPAPPAMTDQPLPPATVPQPAIVVALETATNGLLMPSETDAPFKIVFFARETPKTGAAGKAPAEPKTPVAPKAPAEFPVKPVMSVEELAHLAGAPKDAKVKIRNLDEFFAVAVTTEDWMNEEEKSTASKFAALLEILKTQLQGAQVLVWGEAEKQVAIIGEAEGGLAGVLTIIVET